MFMTKREAIIEFEIMIENWKLWKKKGDITIPFKLCLVENEMVKFYHPLVIYEGARITKDADRFNNINAAIKIAKLNIEKFKLDYTPRAEKIEGAISHGEYGAFVSWRSGGTYFRLFYTAQQIVDAINKPSFPRDNSLKRSPKN